LELVRGGVGAVAASSALGLVGVAAASSELGRATVAAASLVLGRVVVAAWAPVAEELDQAGGLVALELGLAALAVEFVGPVAGLAERQPNVGGHNIKQRVRSSF